MERDNKPIIIMGIATLLVMIIAIVLIIVKPFDKQKVEPTTEATTEADLELDVPTSGVTEEEVQSTVNTNISIDVQEGRCLNVFGAVIDLQSSQYWNNANTTNAGYNNGGITVNEHGGVTHVDPNVPIDGETDDINDENGNGIDDNFESGGDGC